jgi:hypothetical protein
MFVLPLKGLLGKPKNDDDEFPAPEYFTSIPTRADITSTTHYYIIGGQHCVVAHQFLIDERNLSPEDVKDAQSFIVTIVWVAPLDFLKLTYYSRVLNQDLAGNRTEGNFLTQLTTVRKSWMDAGKPMHQGILLCHSLEFSFKIA